MSRPIEDAPTVLFGEKPTLSYRADAHAIVGGAEVAAVLSHRLEDGGVIAKGGFCLVRRAHDKVLGRNVAVKLVLPERAGRPNEAQRFLHEAQITAQLDHPHVVPLHDLGVTPDGRPFFTMKLVEGRTFQDVLEDEAFSPTDPRMLADALRVLIRVCEAVAYAHSKEVLHLDLKPLNIMVGQFGQVYVMDWGLAQRIPVLRASKPGQIPRAGTPGYMSPEQARGEMQTLDARADVFSLGAILYRILAGLPPYGLLEPAVVKERMKQGDLLPPDVQGFHRPLPRRLVAICVKATAANREERFGSVLEFKRALEDYLEGTSRFPTRTFRPGERIVEEGAPGDDAFVILRGRCEVSRQTEAGGRQVLREMRAGDIFGETALLTSGLRSATVTALEETTVAVVGRASLEEELDRSWIAGQVIRTLAARFADLTARLDEKEAPPRRAGP